MIKLMDHKQNHQLQRIIATADDAANSKFSTCSMGYYEDPFLSFFLNSSSSTNHAVVNTEIRQSIHEHTQDSLRTTHQSDTKYNNEDRKEYANYHSIQSLQRIQIQQNLKQRYSPVLRRGTHARQCIIDYSISKFLHLFNSNSNIPEVQIVILGSGKDTTYLRAQCGLLHGMENGNNVKCYNDSSKKIRWYEVDYNSVIVRKVETLHKCPLIDFHINHEHALNRINNHNDSSCSNEMIIGDSYHIRPIAIRKTTVENISKQYHGSNRNTKFNELKSSSPFSPYGSVNMNPKLGSNQSDLPTGNYNQHHHHQQQQNNIQQSSYHDYYLIGYDLSHPFTTLLNYLIQQYSFRTDVPTLFVMECVQMYLPESSSNDLLKSITTTCQYPLLSLYDPILGLQNDPFGQIMEQNLYKANIINSSMTIVHRRTLQSHYNKLLECGFDIVVGCDMMQGYENILSNQDRERAIQCEMLDELEELVLIMKHYCFVIGVVAGGEKCLTLSGDGSKDENPSDIRSHYRDLMNQFCTIIKKKT